MRKFNLPANLLRPLCTMVFSLLCVQLALGQQINISRIDQMPNSPTPYEMRDWKQVAMGYDSLVFDLNRSGNHLPLIWINSSTVNYPDHPSFGLDSYVGTYSDRAGEAINVLPAVIGASLVGIDKSNQDGYDWVLMCEEFFNRQNGENIYLNNYIGSSGSDWWYETMPNVFFYQLNDLYPNTGDFANQFTSVADRWLSAVEAMGGGDTPWNVPGMNYRAWSFSTMTGLTDGVKEPEAAGAIAWILYNAYVETGEERYRLGAEWSMEFLNGLSNNPSYELQMPYGAYAAARMNAELGTDYNIEKMVNWCFDLTTLRYWGAIIGTWGPDANGNDHDVHGLIGEIFSNDYAFLMNGFEAAGALVPMTRYDDRFSRAIGKWVLNLANASRLLYSSYLPGDNQDCEDWSLQNDPDSYIGYEAMREHELNYTDRTPYATGDALRGGWAATNLALYGSSHVGILGGIIATTNVPMILKLDMLKTDFYHDEAYPTFLFYNPYSVAKSVEIDVGGGSHDLYDAVSNSFLGEGVTGVTSFTIPADQAVQLVIAPTGGTTTYDLELMFINGVVVDYRSAQAVLNHPPRIKSLAADPIRLGTGSEATLYCTADDIDEDELDYLWRTANGTIFKSGSSITWTAPDNAGNYPVFCLTSDGHGLSDNSVVVIEVLDNFPPSIEGMGANPPSINLGRTTTLTCTANDPDGDSLTYSWNAEQGTLNGSGATIDWTAPSQRGYYYISCRVDDGRGAQVTDSVGVTVGGLVAHYPFNGNADDISSFENHGTVNGATLVADRFGNQNSAYGFDGVDDHISVSASETLNFQEAISISLWMKFYEFPNREAFLISHGSWQNRWKISLIPEKRLRWTLKTDATSNSGIVDLDTQTLIAQDSLYHVAVTFGDGEVRIYLNGVLNSSMSWSGSILQSSIDLTIGQMLPGDSQYNFPGVIDDILIYNYALSQAEIYAIFNNLDVLDDDGMKLLPTSSALHPNYPNPFNSITTVSFQLPRAEHVTIDVRNISGRLVGILVNERKEAGYHTVRWKAVGFSSGIYFLRMKAGSFTNVRKCVLVK